MDWPTIFKSARTAFERGVNDWILRSRVQGGWIQGPNAELTPGSLTSAVDFEAGMRQAMLAAGVPLQVAQILARELWSAWKEWADGFRISLPGAYPGLAAVPGPQAPPTPASQGAYPLTRGTSVGDYRLRAATLDARLSGALRPVAKNETARMAREIKALAGWVEASFREWKLSAQVVGLMGKGPVPTFAPPYVPVGPVVMGDNVSAPGHVAAIAGPRFGTFAG